MILHGTAIAIGDFGILLRGQPGAGKSSLALRMIDSTGFGTGGSILKSVLVADDQVVISKVGQQVFVSPPEALAGLIEVRGLGILPVPFLSRAALGLVVDLKAWPDISRLPDEQDETTLIEGVRIGRMMLDANDVAAAARLRAAVALASGRKQGAG
jgi:HPr kinase/phosphorylase